jgi:ribonuclease Z
VSPASVTRICITHFHGDHCLGLPGMLLRLGLSQVDRPVPLHFPASGAEYVDRLRHGTIAYERTPVDLRPVDAAGTDPATDPGATCSAPTCNVSDTSPDNRRDIDGLITVAEGPPVRIRCAPLDHTPRDTGRPGDEPQVDVLGWRVEEPDGVRMLTDRLRALGIAGPRVGRLQRDGSLTLDDGRVVRLEDVSERRPGRSFAFVMDTRWCDGALALARGVDLLVIESTFLQAEEVLAHRYGHLTAAQVGRLVCEAGVRRVVLTHFSERYPDASVLAEEAWAAIQAYEGPGPGFRGGREDVIAARDLDHIGFPHRR